MSLTDEQRKTIVILEMVKARDSYKATEILADAKLWRDGNNQGKR